MIIYASADYYLCYVIHFTQKVIKALSDQMCIRSSHIQVLLIWRFIKTTANNIYTDLKLLGMIKE